MKITNVIKELEEFLESKRYLDKRKYNESHRKELESITFFLIINSHINEKIKGDIAQCAHLMNIVPMLSQCLLANIVVELGLVEPYCGALHLIPIEAWEPLLTELLHCIKKTSPELSIRYSYILLKNIIIKLGSIESGSSKMSDVVKSLEDIEKQLLLNCSYINVEMVQGLKKTEIYKFMGLSLLTVLKLLQCCQVDNECLIATIGNLINTSTSIVLAVTLDVFCTWAEVNHQGHPLQMVIGEEAFQVIEKYQKFKPAKELIQMLVSIAKKPRTLAEQIQLADTTTIINKVSSDVENRSRWFKALLRTNIFSNPSAAGCVKANSHLCTLEDMHHLLNMLIHHKTQENVDLFIKCASCLNESDLVSLLVRYYYHHGLKNNLGGSNQLTDQLIYILNKLDTRDNKINKDILLLLICEPKVVLKHLYKECVKSDLVITCLEATFRGISDFVEIEGLFLTTLTEVFDELKFDDGNIDNYKKLLGVLCEKTSASNKVANKIFVPNCLTYLTNKELESLRLCLILYTSIIKNSSEEEVKKLLEFCCSVLEEFRWIIYDFSYLKVQVCQLAVDFLLLHRDSNMFPFGFSSKYPLNDCYFSNTQSEEEFFKSFIPKFSNDDHGEQITWLLRVLPLCLVREWVHIANNLRDKLGEVKVLELYTDVLILIAELVKTQPMEGSQNIRNGFKYCIENYGFIIKKIFINLNEDDINVSIANNICKLLKHLPKDMKNMEAMSLASIIPDSALKSLAHNKDFVNKLRSLECPNISVCIARRMLHE